MEEVRSGTERAFREYGHSFSTMIDFKYLGRILSYSNDDLTEVVGNLQKAQKKWAQVLRILVMEGSIFRCWGTSSRRWSRWLSYLGIKRGC